MEHPVIQLRQATPNDAPVACDLLRRAIEDGCAADHGGSPDVLAAWLGNKTPANVQAWFTSPANHAVIAECDAVLAGLALLTQAGKLALFYVRPDLVRGGVGRAMLGAVEAQARLWNISKIHMHSPTSATPFFERLGYVNAGKDKACFGLEMDFLWKHMDASVVPPRKRFCNCGE